MRKAMGFVLVIVGALLALGTTGVLSFTWEMLWPVFVLLPALGFHIAFFSNPRAELAGLLVPGGVTGVVGVFFLYLNVTGWDQMEYLWPVFILAPAVGLFELYLFGTRNPYLLIPVFILTTVSLVFLGVNLLNSMFGTIAGVALIIVGLLAIFGKKDGKDRKDWF
ncbi:MAG: hypothetical protein ACXVP5_08595 [Tumebacillaceae bacterium]